ncbi:MAG: NADH-quinone oxidoreductase subunit H [Candidatus Margulisbacteria bacterium]|nr:NADH-quinone oxidoreductase subunit H [Candidatus Margulisiibacteriota bacterium]MBU1617814.1 NADH-quinone oxidoreductase subunit H [Candidatus Margulisiibacteriota bacterium]
MEYGEIIKILLMLAAAPLISGVISRIKNNLRLRRGPGIFQPYFNLGKLFKKEARFSEHSSWLTKVTPYIVLGSVLSAAVFMRAGDLILLVFVLSLGRFFLALAGLDPASPFGGLGSSREMFFAGFLEPIILLAIFASVLSGGGAINASSILAASALFLATLAETSRVPVDNQETHLELTMVHEAMVLEYSGRSLALIELASYLKQAIFFSLILLVLWPFLVSRIGWYLLSLLGLAVIVAFTEVSLAKMRLFRVVDFLFFAGILALLAVISAALGV